MSLVLAAFDHLVITHHITGWMTTEGHIWYWQRIILQTGWVNNDGKIPPMSSEFYDASKFSEDSKFKLTVSIIVLSLLYSTGFVFSWNTLEFWENDFWNGLFYFWQISLCIKVSIQVTLHFWKMKPLSQWSHLLSQHSYLPPSSPLFKRGLQPYFECGLHCVHVLRVV